MMRAGANNLNRNVEMVNALNVFPVPDGDTGTNMSLTITSGVKEMEKFADEANIGKLAEALAKGLLMGARGNSGVILSQLFRGFSKALAGNETMSPRQLAEAFQRGVETAYKAVLKPVEGTILTVAREAAEAGVKRSRSTNDPIEVLEAVVNEAKVTLDRTPEMLPVLKQAGVVDAGGEGLLLVYKGMLSVLTGEVVADQPATKEDLPSLESLAEMAHHDNAQAKIDPATIENGYCTEFMVDLKTTRRPVDAFSEGDFREELSQFGDSLLVISDEELVKVHIHAEHPGDALSYAQKYGDLIKIKIENMREQYATATEGHTSSHSHGSKVEKPAIEVEKKPYGIVSIVAGSGVADIMRSLGVDVVIEGGQTMNPSTEDIVKAIGQIHAEHIIILPNNKNIIWTAEQVGEVVDVPVTVLATKTIPQGLASLLAFDKDATPEANKTNMTSAYKAIRSGELTYAVRDTQIDEHQIKQGDYLGITEGKIEVVGQDLMDTAFTLLGEMAVDGADVVTVIYGQDVSSDQADELTKRLGDAYPDVEIEVHDGGQPLYYFLFSVE
nr:DAK2 domain-containing protein [Baia soyae]